MIITDSLATQLCQRWRLIEFFLAAESQKDTYRVAVVDDLGYVKLDNAEPGVLFELIAHRYECGCQVITSNHPFSTWSSIFWMKQWQ